MALDKIQTIIEEHRQDAEKAIYEVINKISRKPLITLDKDDKAFLKARASYLTDAQRKEYANILNPQAKQVTKVTTNK